MAAMMVQYATVIYLLWNKFVDYIDRWMCDVKDKISGVEVRQWLGFEAVLQRNMFWWFNHIVRNNEINWLEKCIDYDVNNVKHKQTDNVK